ncbi:hypothetical protein [uncultured Phascolarctobacterium sp.]|uniref:hypothetical protein n=1 Tax=uncultured Phascolarctobacterium sp. TaxID=512296 RepID=UPI0025FA174C|nr:hypothetical protein [uncultured Phascolarctobacterium sp.]
MQIEFEIDQQRLTRTSDAYLIEGSKNFVECVFSFSSDWNELDKWALFKRNNNTYEIFIENNKCLVPIQCTSAEGEFTISVVGRKNAESVTGTASDKLLTVRGSEFVGGMGEEGRLTETYLVEVLAEVKALHEKTAASETNAAQSAQEAADSAAAALQSEKNAKASETAAEISKEAAAQSEANSKTSEDAARGYANDAEASKGAAAALAVQAAGSANAAAESAKQAVESEKKAAQSETNAKLSETNSKTSETNSQNSASESAQSAANAEKSNKSAEKHSTDAGASADNAELSAQQVSEQAEQVNRDAMQVVSDKKTVTELTGQAVNAAGNAKTYMEQAGQIKADIDAQGTEIITQATAQADRAQSAADGIRDTADTLQADNEHLKAELKHANRRISVLYDLGKGITHRYETDNDTAYSKDIPSGAKVMDVKLIGGKSVAGNQLIQDVKFEQGVSSHGTIWHPRLDADVTVDDGVATFITTKQWEGVAQNRAITQGHKYFISISAKSDKANNVMLCPYIDKSAFGTENQTSIPNTEWNKYAVILTALKTSTDISIGFRAAGDSTIIGATNSCKNVQFVDLTQMFGAGNEPTLEQFQAMLTRPDYPYNAGTLVSADVTAVQVGDKVISLPNSISLKSAGSVYDSLEFYEADGKYYQRHTQRVGVVPSLELASCQVERAQSHDIPCFVMICDKLKERSEPIQTIQINRYTSAMEVGRHVDVDMMCINDGASAYNLYWRNDSIQSAEAFQKHLVDDDITIYYELATPIVTVTEVDNRFDAVDCKAGDKIMFVGNSDYHLPVPNEEEYLIALNEVTV